jgi:hypothetical protein
VLQRQLERRLAGILELERDRRRVRKLELGSRGLKKTNEDISGTRSYLAGRFTKLLDQEPKFQFAATTPAL